MERPGENQIIVSLGAVFASKWPQQEKGKKEQFDHPAPMRPPNVQTFAGWTASQQIKSSVGHGHRADVKS